MPTEKLSSDDLLDPISPDQPAGDSLRLLPEWDRIKEARQSDDGLSAGKWAKRESKSADWRLARDLASGMLRTRSKDLQLAMWLTEANLKLDGFIGLRDGLAVVRELMNRFWDAGLYPLMEDGPEDRSGPFEWMDERLADSVLGIPITRCSKHDRNYTLLNLRDARLVGSEAHYKNEDGDVDPQKKREYEKALAEGRISLDMFEQAVRDTPRSACEDLSSEFEEAYAEFNRLEKVIEDKFAVGEARESIAPNLGNIRVAFKDLQQEMADLLKKKREQEPLLSPVIRKDSGGDEPGSHQEAVTLRFPLSCLTASNSANANGMSWQEAERSIRSGQVEAGLTEMTRLAAAETTGRSRFERKLVLAEVCLASRRERLARAVLEELAEQIETHHLETWESTELISSVWSRLYELYKRGDSSDSDEASKLYGKLCRLDPWQALRCSD